MAEHPNIGVVRRSLEAFAKGDLDTFRELLAPDAVWHIPGSSPLSGDYKGTDEIFGFFGKLRDLTGGTFTNEVHDVVGGDEHVVILVRSTAKRAGKSLDQRRVGIAHVKQGKIAETWNFWEDQAAVDTFIS